MFKILNMKKALFPIIFIIGSNLYGQTFTDYNFNSSGGQLRYSLNPDEKLIEGSPFIIDSWHPCILFMEGDKTVKLDKMKLNIFLDNIIYQSNGTEYIIPNKSEVKKFTLDQTEYLGSFYESKGSYAFFQVLKLKNNIYLLKKYSCTITKGSPSKGYTPATNDHYTIRESYYIKEGNKDALAINIKKGSEILQYLSEEFQGKAKVYIAENNLKMKSVDDLMVLIENCSE